MKNSNCFPPQIYFFVVLSKFNIYFIRRRLFISIIYDNGTYILNLSIIALIIVISSFQTFEDNVV